MFSINKEMFTCKAFDSDQVEFRVEGGMLCSDDGTYDYASFFLGASEAIALGHALVEFGLEKEASMKEAAKSPARRALEKARKESFHVIEKFNLSDIVDRANRKVGVSIDLRDNCLISFSVDRGVGGTYYLEQVIHCACANRGDFVIHDGYDCSQNTTLPYDEIKKVAKEALTMLPPWIGELKISVEFVPNDPTLPF